MITTLYDSADKGDNVITTITAETGLFLAHVDLDTIYNGGDTAAIEVTVTTNGTAPGSGKNLTLNYAFSSGKTDSVAELTPASAQFACALPNTASVKRVFLAPVLFIGARYLHLWFDHDAIAAGAQLTVNVKVNGKRS